MFLERFMDYQNKTVIISPFSRNTPGGAQSPKNYPWWSSVVKGLQKKGIKVIQISAKGECKIGADEVYFGLTFMEIEEKLLAVDLFCSVDNFFPHFANNFNKRGVVIFSKSDPNLFGYKENTNLLKSKEYLRNPKEQYMFWEGVSYDKSSFVSPEEVVEAVCNRLQKV